MKPLRLYKKTEDFQNEVVRRAFQYEEDVISGVQIANKWIKLGVKRSRYLREKYSYSEYELRNVANLFYHMYIPIKDRPTQFMPSPWQCWILLNLFAIIDPDTGKRLHDEALLFVARKSGKTMFGGALSIVFLVKYGGMSAECFGAATTQEQAKQLMNYTKVIIRNSPKLKKRIRVMKEELVYDDGTSENTLIKLSEQQAERADGKNPSYCLYDEAHAFKTDALKEVVMTGMGARWEPLFMTVTTAGFLLNGYPLFDQVELAKDVLQGKKEDDHTFYALYMLDDEKEALGDVAVLEKANPGIGSALTLDRLKAMRDKARLLPSKWRHFLVKNCNIFQKEESNPYIADELYVKCCHEFYISELAGGRCWIGIDLSKTIDLAALTALVEHPVTKRLYVIPYHYFPGGEEEKKVRPNGVDLTDWIEAGLIKEHVGRIDLLKIKDDIVELMDMFNVVSIGYDPFHAHELVANLKAEYQFEVEIKPFSQRITMMSPPTEYLEALVYNQEIELGRNPVLRYCFSNALIKHSRTSSLIQVVKDEQLNSIDSCISTIVAVGMWMDSELDDFKIFMDK